LPTRRPIDPHCRRDAARACGFALFLAAVETFGATLSVGAGQPIGTIADAARVARDGDVVEITAGDYRGDVAVWRQRRLTIRGVGGTPVLRADGRIAEGKAIWVIRNGDFTIENVAFEGARARDRNGAGIRFESGKLIVISEDGPHASWVKNAQPKEGQLRVFLHGRWRQARLQLGTGDPDSYLRRMNRVHAAFVHTESSAPSVIEIMPES